MEGFPPEERCSWSRVSRKAEAGRFQKQETLPATLWEEVVWTEESKRDGGQMEGRAGFSCSLCVRSA